MAFRNQQKPLFLMYWNRLFKKDLNRDHKNHHHPPSGRRNLRHRFLIQFSFPKPDGTPYRVTFSGDLGGPHTPIIPDPDPPDACDLLIMESTYGDRNHENRADRLATLANTLDHALSDSGIVYIPAFALGRTQELIYELDRINPGVPVFIDSPLGIRITRLYQAMDDCWDREAKALKAAGDHPIRFKHLYAVEKFQDHRRLLHLTGPAVIIAGYGMCTGGRIVNHP
jgi:metallo-beta-lactamase family protein